MKQAAILLAGALTTQATTQPTYVPFDNFLISNAVIEVTGEPAYLPGGDGLIVVPTATTPKIYYEYLEPGKITTRKSYVYADLDLTPVAPFPLRVALAPGQGSLRTLVTATSAGGIGAVQLYTGEYSAWSSQQILTSTKYTDPDKAYYTADSRFGSTIAFDRDSYETLFVGCGKCSNEYGLGHGAIYLYEQDKKKSFWTQTHEITSDKLFDLGLTKIAASNDLLLATTTIGPVLFRKTDDDYQPEQLIGSGQTIASFDVYDEVIAYGVTTVPKIGLSNVGAVYVLASAEPPPAPKGKPKPPVQWSVQQVLFPKNPVVGIKFGSKIMLDKNRMVVSNGVNAKTPDLEDVYMYQRSTSTGKWSLQQMFNVVDTTVDQVYPVLGGSTVVLVQNDARLSYHEQSKTVDCLVLSIEDHFGDGWDIARLLVTAPDGSKEYYHSRCDLANPHRVRYCPKFVDEDGLHKFEVIDAAGKSKNYWEIQWKVYDEAQAKWYLGDHETKMDFEWDSKDKLFLPKRVSNLAPNTTCNYCTPEPTYKPTPVFRGRALKSNDDKLVWPNTRNPTPSPAPTLANTNIGNWRVMILKTANAWFDDDASAYFYVADSKSRRLITKGTLCPGEASGKRCWVDLPDGNYNVRVGGALLVGKDPRWQFCRSLDDLPRQYQMSIKITDGECVPYSGHISSSYCHTTTPTASIQIEFMILGVSSQSMTEADYYALRGAVAYAFPGLTADDVQIASVVTSSENAFVSANVNVGENLGYDVLSFEGLDDALSYFKTYLASDGHLTIWSGLQSSERKSTFSTSTAIQFVSARLINSKDSVLAAANVVETVQSLHDETTTSYVEKSSSSHSSGAVLESASVLGYFLAVAAVIALAVGLFLASNQSKDATSDAPEAATAAPVADCEEYVPEVEKIEHVSTRVQLKDLNLSPLNMTDLKNHVKSEDQVLKIMLDRGI